MTLKTTAESDATPGAVTRDTVLGGRVTLFQPVDGYRAAIDPVILAAAVPLGGRPQHIVDLGCGAGAVGFCLMARDPALRVTGVDRDPAVLALARRGAEANRFVDRFNAQPGDVAAPAGLADLAPVDQVVANPPFLPAARGSLSPAPRRRASDAEIGATLADWVDAARRLLVHKGRLTMIHRADRVAELMAVMRADFGDLTICPLWPRAGAAAKRVIVRGRKGSGGPDVISPGWVLHGADNRFRAATDRLLAGGGFDLATGRACE